VPCGHTLLSKYIALRSDKAALSGLAKAIAVSCSSWDTISVPGTASRSTVTLYVLGKNTCTIDNIHTSPRPSTAMCFYPRYT